MELANIELRILLFIDDARLEASVFRQFKIFHLLVKITNIVDTLMVQVWFLIILVQHFVDEIKRIGLLTG